MRWIFAAMTWADFFTPIKGIIEGFTNDSTPLQSNSWTFFIPYGRALAAGWNALDIEELLKKYGVKVWGGQYQVTADEYIFIVSRNQAQWAEYLMNVHGIPMNERFAGAPAPKELVKEGVEGRYEVTGQPKKSNPLVLFLKAGQE